MYDEDEPIATGELPPLIRTTEPPGWLIAAYPVLTDTGVILTRLDIRSDPVVTAPRNGITATVLESISLPEIRSHIAEAVERAKVLAQKASSATPADSPFFDLRSTAAQFAEQRASRVGHDQPQRTTIRKLRVWADQANDVLDAAKIARAQKHGIIRVLEQRWDMNQETVKTRVRRLKQRGYVRGRGREMISGPALDEWRESHQDDEEEN